MRNDVTNTPHALAIKAAFKRLVDHCGGLDLAALSVRCSAGMLSFYGHPNTDVHPPADVVTELERVCGVPEVTRVCALMNGHALLPVPDGAASLADCAALVRALMGTAGPLSVKVLDALADGRIDERERLKLAGPAREFMISAFGLAHALGVVE